MRRKKNRFSSQNVFFLFQNNEDRERESERGWAIHNFFTLRVSLLEDASFLFCWYPVENISSIMCIIVIINPNMYENNKSVPNTNTHIHYVNCRTTGTRQSTVLIFNFPSKVSSKWWWRATYEVIHNTPSTTKKHYGLLRRNTYDWVEITWKLRTLYRQKTLHGNKLFFSVSVVFVFSTLVWNKPILSVMLNTKFVRNGLELVEIRFPVYLIKCNLMLTLKRVQIACTNYLNGIIIIEVDGSNDHHTFQSRMANESYTHFHCRNLNSMAAKNFDEFLWMGRNEWEQEMLAAYWCHSLQHHCAIAHVCGDGAATHIDSSVRMNMESVFSQKIKWIDRDRESVE